MDRLPSDFVAAVQNLAMAGGKWGVLAATGEDAADEQMGQVEELYQQLSELEGFGEDPVQIKDMACACGGMVAAEQVNGGDGLEDWQGQFENARNPQPEGVSEQLWSRLQKLCQAAARLSLAEQQGEDEAAGRAERELDRHARCLAGFGPGQRPSTREAFDSKVAEVMPGSVIMFSGCMDSQTSADVANTASFGLPADAGPGGAGGACTNSMIKALLNGESYSWVTLLQAMRRILDGQYTQIPQLSSSKPMDLNSPFSIVNPNPSGRYRALMVGINYVGSSAELRGCHNDVETMKNYLTQNGYSEDDMRILMDDGEHQEPTKDGIVSGMQWLVEGAAAGDSLFFHYSGHGASVRDDDGDEADGKDECLVPLDFQGGGGLLRDDDVFKCLVAPLQEGVSLTCVLDCCHSGTILDLPYMFKADDNNLAAVADGGCQEMPENPNFDFGKVFEVIKKHPALCAAAVVAGGVYMACAGPEGRQQALGFMMSMASSFFG